jgi:hypothetical protein
MLADLLTQPVTVLAETRGSTIDAYGTGVPTVVPALTVGYLQQNSRAEKEGFVPVETWLLILPAGTDLNADDQVIVAGEQFTVNGAPWPVANPRTGLVDHLEATLARAAGGLEGQ